MKTDFQDRVDEYILDRMSDEEKVQFEAEVNQDESKKEQLEFTRNLKEAISSREDKLVKLKSLKRKYDRDHQQITASMRATGTDYCCYSPAPSLIEKKPSKRIWWWASGIAAVLVIGLFIVNPFVSDTLQTPSGFSPSFKGRPNEMIRGEENDVFDVETPILNDSIKGNSIKDDTIPSRDTMEVIKEK